MGIARNSDPVSMNATYRSSQSEGDGVEEDSLLSKIFNTVTKFSRYQDQPVMPESDR